MKYRIKPEAVLQKELTDDEVVDAFIVQQRVFIDNPKFKGSAELVKEYCLYRLKKNEFGPVYKDLRLIWAKSFFESYLERFFKIYEVVEEKSEAKDIIKIKKPAGWFYEDDSPDISIYTKKNKSETITQKQIDNHVYKINMNAGKYAIMIQKMYAVYRRGLSYMEIVELLYTGTTNNWSSKEKKASRGLGASNLCAGPLGEGILQRWFYKSPVGRWVPKKELYPIVFGDNFQPFSNKHKEVK